MGEQAVDTLKLPAIQPAIRHWRERVTAQGCTVRTIDEIVIDVRGRRLVRHIELECKPEAKPRRVA